MEPRAKNCLRDLAMLFSTATLADSELLLMYPRYLAWVVIDTEIFERFRILLSKEAFLEIFTTSVLDMLRVRPLLEAKSDISGLGGN